MVGTISGRRILFSFEWKRVGVVDGDSGDDGLMGEMSLDNWNENNLKSISLRKFKKIEHDDLFILNVVLRCL